MLRRLEQFDAAAGAIAEIIAVRVPVSSHVTGIMRNMGPDGTEQEWTLFAVCFEARYRRAPIPKGSSTPTRVTADIAAAAAAAAVAPAENRTVAEQINHWVRVGMQIERSGSVTSRRVLAVANGDEQFSTLAPTVRAAAHALVDARISERISKQQFGRDTRAAGSSAVSLDDDGNLIEITADGKRRRL